MSSLTGRASGPVSDQSPRRRRRLTDLYRADSWPPSGEAEDDLSGGLVVDDCPGVSVDVDSCCAGELPLGPGWREEGLRQV